MKRTLATNLFAAIVAVGFSTLCVGCQSATTNATVYLVPPGQSVSSTDAQENTVPGAGVAVANKELIPLPGTVERTTSNSAPITITISANTTKPIDVDTKGSIAATGNSVGVGAGATGGAIAGGVLSGGNPLAVGAGAIVGGAAGPTILGGAKTLIGQGAPAAATSASTPSIPSNQPTLALPEPQGVQIAPPTPTSVGAGATTAK